LSLHQSGLIRATLRTVDRDCVHDLTDTVGAHIDKLATRIAVRTITQRRRVQRARLARHDEAPSAVSRISSTSTADASSYVSHGALVKLHSEQRS